MKQILCTMVLSMLTLGISAIAEDFYIYPTKGQPQKQIDQDKYECYNWAKEQTEFDPMEMPKATSAPPTGEKPKGGVARGALGGAAAGAIVGEIASNDAGKGAVIGAVAGGLFGGMRRNNQVQLEQSERQQWEQDQANQYASARNAYNRAYVACLEGRGYTVK